MTQPVAVTKQYAIYIGLSPSLIASAREQLAKSDCMETAEVVVQFEQKVRVFTFEEFISKLFTEGDNNGVKESRNTTETVPQEQETKSTGISESNS